VDWILKLIDLSMSAGFGKFGKNGTSQQQVFQLVETYLFN